MTRTRTAALAAALLALLTACGTAPTAPTPGAADVTTTTTAPEVDLFDQPFPWLIAHRGGPALWPEASWEAYEASAKGGFMLEGDARMLADGTLVVLHDPKVDRTMTGVTGPVDRLTTQQWRAARVRPASAGGEPGRSVVLEEMLETYGGKHPIVMQLYGPGAREVADMVQSMGLDRDVVLQTFEWDVAQYWAGRGLRVMFLLRGEGRPSPDAITAAGIEYAGVDRHEPGTVIRGLEDAGLPVIVWTVNSVKGYEAALAAGASGVFTDDPWKLEAAS